MKNIHTWKKLLTIIPALIFAFCVLLPAFDVPQIKADENEVTEIWTYEDLLKIAENPTGSYSLMTDLDLKWVEWTPVDFSGTFEGNGHGILNVRISSTGGATHTTIDGNRVEYDTIFAGFFSSLVNAYVGNLKILGEEISVTTDVPTFIGGIAGYMENSRISGCAFIGKETLVSSGHSIGVGGVAGYGKGTIENTYADTTLICTDTDREYKEEQFMGGAYAAGFIDLSGNVIKINGFDSDHGYVHNGGLVGMYIQYPEPEGYPGYVTGNTVEGQITFYEDNEDRRAYCEAYIGEIMCPSLPIDEGFSGDLFTRNEVYDYDVILLPHYCENPHYETNVVGPTETENGYTVYTCTNCGYVFIADYTPVLGSAAEESPEEQTETEAEEAPKRKPLPKRKPSPFLFAMIGLTVIVIVVLTLLLRQKQNLTQRRLRDQRIAEKRKAAQQQPMPQDFPSDRTKSRLTKEQRKQSVGARKKRKNPGRGAGKPVNKKKQDPGNKSRNKHREK